MGGMVAAIERGYPQAEIAESAYRSQRAIESREQLIVGVNEGVSDERDADARSCISTSRWGSDSWRDSTRCAAGATGPRWRARSTAAGRRTGTRIRCRSCIDAARAVRDGGRDVRRAAGRVGGIRGNPLDLDLHSRSVEQTANSRRRRQTRPRWSRPRCEGHRPRTARCRHGSDLYGPAPDAGADRVRRRCRKMPM